MTFTNNLNPLAESPRSLYIIHLDDHRIIREYVKKGIIGHFSNCTVDTFEHPDQALEQISLCLENNMPVDLVISDVRHPEPNGIRFSVMIRELEKKYGKRIPILIISMYISESFLAHKEQLIRDGIWDRALPKTMSTDEINREIGEMLGLVVAEGDFFEVKV